MLNYHLCPVNVWTNDPGTKEVFMVVVVLVVDIVEVVFVVKGVLVVDDWPPTIVFISDQNGEINGIDIGYFFARYDLLIGDKNEIKPFVFT